MTLGLRHAGFRSVGAVEIDRAAARTWAANLLDSPSSDSQLFALGPERGDIRRVDFRKWPALLRDQGVRELDLLAGGPPCQAFSRVGRGKLNTLAKKGFVSDPRNQLWQDFFRAVNALQPRVFIIENVPGMLHHGGINVAEHLCQVALSSGYNPAVAVLDASAFGVPQVRERLIILGVREDLCLCPMFDFGADVKITDEVSVGAHVVRSDIFDNTDLFHGHVVPIASRKRVTVGQAIGDLPVFTAHLKRGYSSKTPPSPAKYRAHRPSQFAHLMRTWPGFEAGSLVRDHFCKATPRDYPIFRAMSQGDRYPDALEIAESRYRRALRRWEQGHRSRRPSRAAFVPPYRADVFPEKWRKLIKDEPSWTVTAHLAKDTYSHIHFDPNQARMITIREAARLQSFPDGFTLHGNVGERFRQIGNAVPPLLAVALGGSVLRILRNEVTPIRVRVGKRAAKVLRRGK